MISPGNIDVDWSALRAAGITASDGTMYFYSFANYYPQHQQPVACLNIPLLGLCGKLRCLLFRGAMTLKIHNTVLFQHCFTLILEGKDFEPKLKSFYEAVTGSKVLKCELKWHSRNPSYGATPDGVIKNGNDHLLEIKACNYFESIKLTSVQTVLCGWTTFPLT